MTDIYPKANSAISHGQLNDYKKEKGFKPRKLFSQKAGSKKLIIETCINQVKAELIGTFSLTEEGKWVFMELILTDRNLVCTCPKDAIEVKQVGVCFK